MSFAVPLLRKPAGLWSRPLPEVPCLPLTPSGKTGSPPMGRRPRFSAARQRPPGCLSVPPPRAPRPALQHLPASASSPTKSSTSSILVTVNNPTGLIVPVWWQQEERHALPVKENKLPTLWLARQVLKMYLLLRIMQIQKHQNHRLRDSGSG